jgi:hypothetical protein
MHARTNSIVRSAATIALAISLATPAVAQGTQQGTQLARTDGRWQAWIGCWTPAGSLIRVVGRSASSVVCIVPTSIATAVDVVTVTGGKIVDSTRVNTDGQPHTIAREGCTGWQSAKWSPSARRVYLKSEYNCSGAPATRVSAVYAMAGAGDWIDVQGMRVDKNSGVHAVRYREAVDGDALPPEITRQLGERSLTKMAATLALTQPISLADVAEASHEVDAAVVSTWLIEVSKLDVERPPRLNAKELEQLADSGVPGSVIDVMLGLSYPDVLSVNPTSRSVARQNSDSAYTPYGYSSLGMMASNNPLIGFDRFGFPIYASEASLMSVCSPWMFGPYDLGWNLYNSQFACSRYGAYGYTGSLYPGYLYGGYGLYGGYFGGYYGGYFGGGPIVVPRAPGSTTTPPPSHGHVVNGRGYQSGSGSGGTAVPTQTTSGAPSSAGTSASSAPPPAPRTAEPKKP